MIEQQVAYITRAKNATKEEFLERYPTHGEIWELLQKAKSGFIKIEKISANTGFLGQGGVVSGYTPAFGEGLSCYIDRIDSYYYTSTIQSINWEDGTFKTLNSIYKFEFDESKN